MTLTPKQFNLLATKDDLKNLRNGLISKDEFNDKCNYVIDKINGLSKEVRDFHAEMASNQVAHNRFEGSIDNLNGRVRKLEVKVI